jgi:hypothetical protein
VIEELPLTQWHGPYDDDVRSRAVTALEQGAVLAFPLLRFGLQDGEERFLDARVSDGKAKNISLDHTTGRMQASSLTGDDAAALAAMIERFGAGAAALVQDLLPYADVERARTSYRPVQVKGRHYSKISDDRLLHVDAFPTRPMHGRRILRFFANIAPASAREWKLGMPFEDFARRALPRVGPHFPGKSWLYGKLGVTRGQRSLYDEYMLSLHDAAKLDDALQDDAANQLVRWPAGMCWMVFTDQALHAALGGEFALEQTFHVDLAQMRMPERAPIRVLERLTGRALA